MELYDYIIIIRILFCALVLSYLNALEKEHCHCTLDYRHKILKNVSYIIIVLNVIDMTPYGAKLDEKYERSFREEEKYSPYTIFKGLLISIYAIILYTYVRDMNNTKCSCALHDERYTHKFLSAIQNFLLIIGIIIFCVTCIHIYLYTISKKMVFKWK